MVSVDESGGKGGAVTLVAKSDKKGKFAFGFPKPGSYVLTASVPELALVGIAVKMRDADRKVPLLVDGTRLEDQSGAVDPAGSVPISIPSIVYSVEMVLTLGHAKASAVDRVPEGAIAQVSALRKAGELIDAGRYDEGLSAISVVEDKAGELSVEDRGVFHYLKSFALVKLGRFEEAEPLIHQAIGENAALPLNPLLAQCLIGLKKYGEAAPVLAQLAESATDPTLKRAHQLNLGQALIEIEQYDEAVAPLRAAFDSDPKDPTTMVQLVNALTLAGRVPEASALLQAPMPAKEAAALNFNLAVVVIRSKRFDEAAVHLRKAIDLDASLVEAHRVLAEVHLARGKSADAIPEFEAYLRARPDAPDAVEVRKILAAVRGQK